MKFKLFTISFHVFWLWMAEVMTSSNVKADDTRDGRSGSIFSSVSYDNDNDGIVGRAGIDYPTHGNIPNTGFSCEDYQWPGYYADVQAQCQVFHICVSQGAYQHKYSFLCPVGTVFHQKYLVCAWWYEFQCSEAPSLYFLNAEIFEEETSVDHSLRRPSLPSASFKSNNKHVQEHSVFPSSVVTDTMHNKNQRQNTGLSSITQYSSHKQSTTQLPSTEPQYMFNSNNLQNNFPNVFSISGAFGPSSEVDYSDFTNNAKPHDMHSNHEDNKSFMSNFMQQTDGFFSFNEHNEFHPIGTSEEVENDLANYFAPDATKSSVFDTTSNPNEINENKKIFLNSNTASNSVFENAFKNLPSPTEHKHTQTADSLSNTNPFVGISANSNYFIKNSEPSVSSYTSYGINIGKGKENSSSKENEIKLDFELPLQSLNQNTLNYDKPLTTGKDEIENMGFQNNNFDEPFFIVNEISTTDTEGEDGGNSFEIPFNGGFMRFSSPHASYSSVVPLNQNFQHSEQTDNENLPHVETSFKFPIDDESYSLQLGPSTNIGAHNLVVDTYSQTTNGQFGENRNHSITSFNSFSNKIPLLHYIPSQSDSVTSEEDNTFSNAFGTDSKYAKENTDESHFLLSSAANFKSKKILDEDYPTKTNDASDNFYIAGISTTTDNRYEEQFHPLNMAEEYHDRNTSQIIEPEVAHPFPFNKNGLPLSEVNKLNPQSVNSVDTQERNFNINYLAPSKAETNENRPLSVKTSEMGDKNTSPMATSYVTFKMQPSFNLNSEISTNYSEGLQDNLQEHFNTEYEEHAQSIFTNFSPSLVKNNLNNTVRFNKPSSYQRMHVQYSNKPTTISAIHLEDNTDMSKLFKSEYTNAEAPVKPQFSNPMEDDILFISGPFPGELKESKQNLDNVKKEYSINKRQASARILYVTPVPRKQAVRIVESRSAHKPSMWVRWNMGENTRRPQRKIIFPS